MTANVKLHESVSLFKKRQSTSPPLQTSKHPPQHPTALYLETNSTWPECHLVEILDLILHIASFNPMQLLERSIVWPWTSVEEDGNSSSKEVKSISRQMEKQRQFGTTRLLCTNRIDKHSNQKVHVTRYHPLHRLQHRPERVIHCARQNEALLRRVVEIVGQIVVERLRRRRSWGRRVPSNRWRERRFVGVIAASVCFEFVLWDNRPFASCN